MIVTFPRVSVVCRDLRTVVVKSIDLHQNFGLILLD